MATKPVSIVDKTAAAFPNTVIATWALANGDDGQPIQYPHFADKTIHFKGVFGTGGSVQWEGSNDGVTWIVLTDPQGNAVVKTTEAIEVVEENPLYIRPRCTAGDGTTALVVIACCVKGVR